MDENIIKILEFLEPFGYKHNGNLTELINQMFPYAQGNKELLENEKKKIIAFLDGLLKSDIVEFDRMQYHYMVWDAGWDLREQWMGEHGFMVSIGLKGLEILKDKRKSDIELSVNNSVIATNKSVQLTNEAIVKTSKNQEAILSKQTIIFFFTAIFTLGAVLFSGISLYRDIHKDTLEKQLLQLSKDTLLLRNRIKILESETSRPKEAKKNQPKKP
jgi:hypothetical protein